jgi:hypothetical protein
MKKYVVISVLYCLISFTSFGQGRKALSPDFLQLQYAGSNGFLSIGLGYDIFKNNARVSINYGHVPNVYGGPLNIISTKLLYVPGTYKWSEKILVSPFDAGLMISYHMGSDFRSRWPTHRYPENYYWWQTSFRFHINYQPSVTYLLSEKNVFKSWTAYLDFNTNELYLVSYGKNLHSLKLSDVIKLGAGIRLHY